MPALSMSDGTLSLDGEPLDPEATLPLQASSLLVLLTHSYQVGWEAGAKSVKDVLPEFLEEHTTELARIATAKARREPPLPQVLDVRIVSMPEPAATVSTREVVRDRQGRIVAVRGADVPASDQ